MRMQIGGNSGHANKKQGLVVRVSGFVEQGEQVGVCGKEFSGEEVTVWLTDAGICASNKSRKSLKNLRDSFKMGNTRHKLEVGGLVHFNRCFVKKNCPNNYISTWANVLGYNAQSVTDTVVYIKNCFVRFFEPKQEDTWKPFGFVSSYQNKIIAGQNIQELQSQIAETKSEINNCTLLVRYLDHNGQVIGFLEIGSVKRFNKEKGCEYSPAEYGANCVTLIEEQLSSYSDVDSVNILVAKTWSISREGLLAEGKNRINFWSFAASHFYKDVKEGENTYRDFFCRDAFGKLSDPSESQVFMNSLSFQGADEDAITADPVLLGGLTYAGQEIPTPKTETSTQSKNAKESMGEDRAVGPEIKVVEKTPELQKEKPKDEPQAQSIADVSVEEGIEIDPKGRVVKKSPEVKPQPQKVKESVPSDDYMNFEQALADGAF